MGNTLNKGALQPIDVPCRYCQSPVRIYQYPGDTQPVKICDSCRASPPEHPEPVRTRREVDGNGPVTVWRRGEPTFHMIEQQLRMQRV